MISTMQELVEDLMYVYQGNIIMFGGYDAYQWICEEYGLTSLSDQLVGTSAYPKRILFANQSNPKYISIFIFASITRRSHQAKSRIMLGLCFKVWCMIKPCDLC